MRKIFLIIFFVIVFLFLGSGAMAENCKDLVWGSAFFSEFSDGECKANMRMELIGNGIEIEASSLLYNEIVCSDAPSDLIPVDTYEVYCNGKCKVGSTEQTFVVEVCLEDVGTGGGEVTPPPVECIPVCGDGKCDCGEITASCSVDCPPVTSGIVPCGMSGDDLITTSVYEDCPCTFCHFFIMFDRIIDFVLIDIIPAVAILLLVIGGIYFFAAGPDPNKLTTAKNIITAVVLGLVIIFSSWIIINMFFDFIGVAEWTGLREGWWQVECAVPGASTDTNFNCILDEKE